MDPMDQSPESGDVDLFGDPFSQTSPADVLARIPSVPHAAEGTHQPSDDDNPSTSLLAAFNDEEADDVLMQIPPGDHPQELSLMNAFDGDGDSAQNGSQQMRPRRSPDYFTQYEFGFPKFSEWTREYNEINQISHQPGLQERMEGLKKKFRDYLFDIQRIHLSNDHPDMSCLRMDMRICIFFGLRMNTYTTIDFDRLITRQAMARTALSNILTFATRLGTVQLLNRDLRCPEDHQCEQILKHISLFIESGLQHVMLTWQLLGLVHACPIEGAGLPRSFEYMFCPKMAEPQQQYIDYMKQVIARNFIKIDFKGNVYIPQHTKHDQRHISTRYYCPMLKQDGSQFKLKELVNFFSKIPALVLNTIKDYMVVEGGTEMPTGKFFLSWNLAHASSLENDISSSGRGKGSALVNEINTYLEKNFHDKMTLLPCGEIVFAFQNMAMQVTPFVKCLEYDTMPQYMRSFQFFDQPLRQEVADLVNEFADLQTLFTNKKISGRTFLKKSLAITVRLRTLSNYLESCMTYQQWDNGTINAFYAFVLPQMICRRHWNHTNEKILKNSFSAQPGGLMVVLVGITGSGKTVLAELINFAIPKIHRMNMSVGGGQAAFQLTQLDQKPHTLFLELSDARESLKSLSKELILQIMGGGDFTIDVKYGLPLELNERCFGMLAATNDQSVGFCQDEYSDGHSMNASERRTLIFLLNHTHLRTQESSNKIDEQLRSQIDSFIAISFILFNVMRQVYIDSSIYDMVSGQNEVFQSVFGTQLSEFRKNINDTGDTFRKLLLVDGMFVSRVDPETRVEDDILCIPMQVLLENINHKLRQLKAIPISDRAVETYLDRIFNDPKAANPTIYLEKHPDFLWRGKHYKDDEIVFGITLSFGGSKRPFLTDIELRDLESQNHEEYEIVKENIRMHMEGLCLYTDPLALFVKRYIMKHWKYVSSADEPTPSAEEYFGVDYRTFVAEFQKWSEKNRFTKVNVERKLGNLLTPENIELVQTRLHEVGWTDVVISKKKILFQGVPGSTFLISNIVSITNNVNETAGGHATPAHSTLVDLNLKASGQKRKDSEELPATPKQSKRAKGGSEKHHPPSAVQQSLSENRLPKAQMGAGQMKEVKQHASLDHHLLGPPGNPTRDYAVHEKQPSTKKSKGDQLAPKEKPTVPIKHVNTKGRLNKKAKDGQASLPQSPRHSIGLNLAK
jgi:hypothetical protein